jgi:hypothetical protein
MRNKDQILLESIYENIILNEMPLYHSGPQKIDVNNVKFDLGAIGFHVGTAEQADFRTHLLKDKKTSNFEIYQTSVDGKLEIAETDMDMAWEHADALLLELLKENIIWPEDAYALLNSWNDEMDPDHFDVINDFIIFIENASEREINRFQPTEEIDHDFLLSTDTYKNRKKLSDIRNLLISKGIGGIKYKNEVEGEGYSFVIFDKRMIAPKNVKVIVGLRKFEKEANDILNGVQKKLIPPKGYDYDKYINKEMALSIIDKVTYNTVIVGYFKIGEKDNEGYPITSVRKIKPIPEDTNPNIIFHIMGHENY